MSGAQQNFCWRGIRWSCGIRAEAQMSAIDVGFLHAPIPWAKILAAGSTRVFQGVESFS
jgi:hypothetical protein